MTQPPSGPPPAGSFGPPPVFPGPGPTPAAPRRCARGRLFAILVAVVVVALLVGGGVWLAGQDTDRAAPKRPQGASPGSVVFPAEKKPGTTKGRLLFDAPLPAPEGKEVDTAGAWATETTYAKVGKEEILGYDLGTNKRAYRRDLGGRACGATQYATTEGKAALLIEPRDDSKARFGPCRVLALLDVDSGRIEWRKMLTKDVPWGPAVTLSQGTVVASWTRGATSFALSGRQLWHKAAEPDEGKECTTEYGGGQRLVALIECGWDHTTFRVQQLNPRTGAAQWTYALPGTGQQLYSISTAGPVVVDRSTDDDDEMFVLDDTGKKISQFSIDLDAYRLQCYLGEGPEECRTAVADADRLYLPTTAHRATGGDARTEITAYDLKSGIAVWQAASAPNRDLTPIRMAGDQLIAYEDDLGEHDAKVVSIDPAHSGKKTTFLTIPKEPIRGAANIYPTLGRAIYAHGRLFLNSELLAAKSKVPSADRNLFVAFGS